MAAAASSHACPVRAVLPEARGVFSLRFDRPAGFSYVAGQYVHLRRPGLADPRGPQRSFTLSSSPTEADWLQITTREGPSAFKQALRASAPGETWEVSPARGVFTLDPTRPALFVAGGIGITPFRSMVRWAADTGGVPPPHLVYSASSPEDFPFRAELDRLASNGVLRVSYTVTQEAHAGPAWSGHLGRVSAAWLGPMVREMTSPKLYLAGPPGMVRELRTLATTELSVPAADVRLESFSGY